MSILKQFVQWTVTWPMWTQFQLVPLQPPTSGSEFTFGAFLSALALFLVVMINTDFRYRYRLSLTTFNMRVIGFWVSVGVGLLLLLIDVWSENLWLVPRFCPGANGLKLILAVVFFSFVVSIVYVAVVRPPRLRNRNARPFFEAHYHFIHQGNVERLQVVAEELAGALPEIVPLAASSGARGHGDSTKVSEAQKCAHDLLLLIGDQRFCHVVVDKVPAFALQFLTAVQEKKAYNLPIFPFTRNVGQEFILNTGSAYYQEDSWFYSGFFGYTQPVTKIIFANFDLVESCAAAGASPLEADYRIANELNERQLEGSTRAALAFFESWLLRGKGRLHSSAVASLFNETKWSFFGLDELNEVRSYYCHRAYQNLSAKMDFIEDAIELVEKHAERPQTFNVRRHQDGDIYDKLSHAIYEAIKASTAVKSPIWTSWVVQHNTVWGKVFRVPQTNTSKIIAFKVRRLLYNEIKKMDKWVNFEGAHILGYCLHVLGLKLIDRHAGYQREFYPLHAAALSWAKCNYGTLLSEHPKVAKAVLMGSLTFDSTNRRFVKTYANNTGKAPVQEFLEID